MDNECYHMRCVQKAVAEYRIRHVAGGDGSRLLVCKEHEALLLAGVAVDLGVTRLELWDDKGKVTRLRVEDGRLIREEGA